MPATVLQQIQIVALGAGASTTLPHGLKNGSLALVPNKVFPDRASPIRVTVATAADVTYENTDADNAQTAIFLVQFDHSIQQATSGGVPLAFLYQGSAIASGGAGIGPLTIWGGGRESYDTNTPALVVGGFEFEAGLYTFTTSNFRAMVATNNAVAGTVRLRNVTDAATVTDLAIASSTQTLVEAAVVLPAASKIYEVQIFLVNPPGVGDSIELYKAELELVA